MREGGERYDGIITQVVGKHLALVDRARVGKDMSIAA